MAIFTVDTGKDDSAANRLTSLREALALAAKTPGADTIVFARDVHTVELSAGRGPLVIAKGQDVAIKGDFDGNGTADVTIDGNDRTSHFVVQAGAIATLDGLVLTHGHAAGTDGTSGAKGIDGADGVGRTGTPDDQYDPDYVGKVGGEGHAGTTGGDAVGSIANYGTLTVSHSIISHNDATGGMGGTGGVGGRGGKGSDGVDGRDGTSAHGDEPGGMGAGGGRGGAGGIGGTGGDGGAGIGAILNAKGGSLALVDVALAANHGSGGKGGTSGQGGRGGGGGAGGDGGIGVPYTDDQQVFHGHDEVDAPGSPGDFGEGGGSGGSSGKGGDGFGGILNEGTITGGNVAFVANSADAGHGGAVGGGGAGGTGGAGGMGRGGQAASAGSNGVGFPGLEYGPGDKASPNQDVIGGMGTVSEQDTLIFVSATHLVADEGDAGSTAFTFNVNRIGEASGAASVNWELAPAKGLPATEFAGGVIPSGTVQFKAGGPDSIAVSFKIKGDVLPEADKTFGIDLTGLGLPDDNALNYGFGTKHADGRIVDDDPVSFVATADDHPAILSSQFSRAAFLSALDGLRSGQIMKVSLPAVVGDVGARTIKADDAILSANAPFDARLTLGAKVKVFSLLGTAPVDVSGNSGANRIIGNAGANELKGLGGADLLSGGDGNDKLRGGDSIDILVGGKGADLLDGGAGGLDVASYAGAARGVAASLVKPKHNSGDAKGDTYKDIEGLSGSGFDDTLAGNGSTLLFGDKGADTFLFQARLGSGKVVDAIADFAATGDRIALDHESFTVLAVTPPKGHLLPQLFVDVGEKGVSVHDERIIYNSRTGDLSFDRDGAAHGFEAVRFAHVEDPTLKKGFPSLVAADFIVV